MSYGSGGYGSTTYAGDSLFFARSHQVDSVLLKIQTKTHSVDAVLLETQTIDHQIDAWFVRTLTHQVDVVLLKIFTKTHLVDALLLKTQSVTYQTDSLLIKIRTHQVEAHLVNRINKTHQADVIIIRGSLYRVDPQQYLPTKASWAWRAARYLVTKIYLIDAVVRSSRLYHSFDRSNGSIAGSAPDIGTALPEQLAKSWSIIDNTLYVSSGTDLDVGLLAWNAATDGGGTDGFAECQIGIDHGQSATARTFGVAARIQDSGNFYIHYFSAGNLRLGKFVGGSFSVIDGPVAHTLVVGQKIQIRVTGTTIEGLIDGVVRVSTTDSSLTTGTKYGIYSEDGGSNNGGRYDDFKIDP